MQSFPQAISPSFYQKGFHQGLPVFAIAASFLRRFSFFCSGSPRSVSLILRNATIFLRRIGQELALGVDDRATLGICLGLAEGFPFLTFGHLAGRAVASKQR